MNRMSTFLLRMGIGRNLLAALALVLICAVAAPAEQQAVTWQLTNFQVVDAGETVEIPKGLLTTGYIMEGDAASLGGPFANGKFQLTLSAFSPFKKMAGQKPGFWYVQGVWTITDVSAAPELAEARYSAAKVRGNLSAQLTFNPATDSGEFSGKVRVPFSPFHGRGTGTFSGDLESEGQLSLVMKSLKRAE